MRTHRPHLARAARTLAALALAAASLAAPARAALRSPQVAVSGTALAAFFGSQAQAIAVVGDQQDLQRLSLAPGAAFRVHVFGPAAGTTTFGLYNASLASPPLFAIFPGAASPGWFAEASFRSSPDRLVVNLFDGTGTLQGTITYLGADPGDFGFYTSGPGGVLYTQDARDPSGLPLILAYDGTGARAGATWFACEGTAAAGGDYADLIVLVEPAATPVEVLRTDWGALKARFR